MEEMKLFGFSVLISTFSSFQVFRFSGFQDFQVENILRGLAKKIPTFLKLQNLQSEI